MAETETAKGPSVASIGIGAEIAEALGVPLESVEIGGRTFPLEEIDLNDLVEIQARVGGIEELDPTDLATIRFLLWLVARKSDPDLTETAFGKLVKMRDLPLLSDALLKVMKVSGLGVTTETESGNAPAPESL